MTRRRSNAIEAEDEEDFLANEPTPPRTEAFDEEELIFADR